MKTTDRHQLMFFIGLLVMLLSFGTTAKAQLPSPPNPPRLVNDYTGTLNRLQVEYLENMLVAYNDSTSTQILVMLVNDLQGYDIHEYATKIGHSWGVGQKGKGNGLVILVKPKKGSDKGYVDISPGYGMEEFVTDATAKNIIEKEMIPEFKEGRYYKGIEKAITVIMDLCSGKFSQDKYNGDRDRLLYVLLTILVFVIFVLLLSKSSGNSGQNYSGGGSRTIWIPTGGGFGGGGGGFGGFGGGGFGGGGASGSW